MREARSMYSDIIELVNLLVTHGKHLFGVSQEIRYFMESCINMRNLSLHHAIYDEKAAYDPIPISLVFAKAIEGASIWKKERAGCQLTAARVSSLPHFEDPPCPAIAAVLILVLVILRSALSGKILAN